MTEQKKVDRAGAGAAETSHIAANPAPARRRRQTAARKQEAVLRVLRGEDIELVARGIDATAADVSGWRDVFLATGASGLKHIARAMPAMRRLIGFAPGWARSPWITSFSSRRSRRWRRATLSGAGGRSDERRHLDLHGQGLRRLPGVPGLESEPGQRVPGPATGPDRGRAAPPPGTTRPPVGCRSGP